jgi:hypothetical protein
MEIFGDLERLLAELYPYRIPLTLGGALAGALVLWGAWRAGWVRRAAAVARRRPVAATVTAALVAAVLLPAAYYLVSPLWIRTTLVEESPLALAMSLEATPAPAADASSPPQPSVGSAATPAPAPFAPRTVLTGMWEGADAFHFAQGTALVIETAPGRYVLRVEDFSVRNGPDLFVYVSPSEGYTEAAVNLGELKATDGAFNYEIPEGLSLEAIRTAVVWCRQFAVLFGTAMLSAP